jgi:hypothetical protein
MRQLWPSFLAISLRSWSAGLWIGEAARCVRRVILSDVQEPFIGSEALERGALNRHQLRTRYRALLPNVYLSTSAEPSLE